MKPSDLKDHLRRGGAATLNHPATYPVSGGAMIAPARYAGTSGSEFVFERRFIDGHFATTVLVDSKTSQTNRNEEGLLEARGEGGPATAIPTITVRYESQTLLDLELPHRFADAHIRAASQGETATVKLPWYRAARDATAADLAPLFVCSPASIGYGVWDSTRGRGQLRLRSLYVSELFGLTAEGEDRVSKRSGARLDPLGQDFHISPDDFEAILDRQRGEMSPTTVKKLEAELAKARKGKQETLSASSLVLGGIPPGLENVYGVSVPEVRRARTYSLAGLRRLRFGGSADDDVAARAALLAMILLGAAYSDADPDIRAYCDVGAPLATTYLDEDEVDLDLSIEACTEFLASAVDGLPDRLAWTGQVQELDGDPALDRGAVDDDDSDE